MPHSKTISIFLKDADPTGIKIAELSNSTIRVYLIPKSMMMEYVKTRGDLDTSVLYMLFDDERTSVYIGETENFQKRIKNHVDQKPFWHWAIICLSTGNSLDKAEIKFLESHSVQKAIDIGRFNVMNKTLPAKNNLHEFKVPSLLDMFDDFELLLSTIGFTVFEPVVDTNIPELPVTTKPAKEERVYDTIVAPCSGDGLESAFRDKSARWAIRIGKSNISKFKYIALYESSPVSAIRYYAKITSIEPYEGSPGKYIIHHDGNIQTLSNPIGIGDNPELSLYGPRYYKLTDIKNSTNLAQLTDKAFGTDYQTQGN